MNQLAKLFLKGLLTVLPVAITIAIAAYFIEHTENLLKPIITLALPAEYYFTGLSVIVLIVFLIAVGKFISIYLFKKLNDLLDRSIESIPIIRTLYSSIKDISRLLLEANSDDKLSKVVLVTLGGSTPMKVIGFVTSESVNIGKHEELTAVYIPMSFQMGGFTTLVAAKDIEYLDIPPQEAMKMVLTGAIQSAKNAKTKN